MKVSNAQIVKGVLIEIAKDLFRYEPDTGDVYAKSPDKQDPKLLPYFGKGGLSCFVTHRGGKRLYTEVANRAGNLYVCFSVRFKGVALTVKNHQIAWLLTYGEWPNEIDHLDGNGLNNKLENLRSVTRSENSRNHKKARNNTSGFNGVSWIERLQKWRAYSYDRSLGENGKQVQLGTYYSFLDACAARKSYDLKNGYSERHGI